MSGPTKMAILIFSAEMKYIIAPRSCLTGNGITPVSAVVLDGYSVANENEIRYRYPAKSLEEITAALDGVIVNRVDALDFLHGRKTITQLKNNEI